MRKFGFGIIAVVLLQIAFGIYMTYQTGAELIAAAISNNAYECVRTTGPINNGNTPAASEPADVIAPQNVVKETTNGEASVYALTASVRPSPDRKRSGGSSAVPRSPGDHVRTMQASVDRTYFGNMVVERKYGVLPRSAKRGPEIVTRQFFGNLVVERRSGLRGVQAANGAGSKKNVYLATSYAPGAKPQLIVSKG